MPGMICPGLGHVGKLLILAELTLRALHDPPRQGGQRRGLGHAPALNHLDTELVPVPADQRRRRRRTAAGDPRQVRQVVATRVGLVDGLDALPDGGHAGGHGDLLVGEQLDQPRRVHEAVRHDLLAAEHERRPGQAPAHGVEHGHDAEQAVGGRQIHAVGHALGHGVQVLGAVLVLHPFRIARGAAGVAQPERRVLVDLRPVVPGRLAGDEGLVVHRVRQVGVPVLEPGFGRNDDALDAGHAALELLEQRQDVGIDDDHLVLGVIDDVLEVVIRQADVQGVQHRAHARGGMVGLQMARAVPHERADPVADADAGIRQRVGELMRAIAGLPVALPAHAGVGGGDDLFARRHRGAAVEDVGHQQRRMLHCHCVALPISSLLCQPASVAPSTARGIVDTVAAHLLNIPHARAIGMTLVRHDGAAPWYGCRTPSTWWATRIPG
jgi:hypothetical protein